MTAQGILSRDNIPHGVNYTEKIKMKGMIIMQVEVEFNVICSGTVIVDVPEGITEDMLSDEILEEVASETWTNSDLNNGNEFELRSYTIIGEN